MSIHQRTSHQHKKLLTNMENCRNNRFYYVYITVMVTLYEITPNRVAYQVLRRKLE